MKKYFFIYILLIFTTPSVFAETFNVSGQDLNIPPPEGYVRVTPEMDAVYRMAQQMMPPSAEMLAYYILSSAESDAKAGLIPNLDYTCMIGTAKILKNRTISAVEFAQFQEVIKTQNRKIFDSVKDQLPEHFDKLSQGISKEFDIDFKTGISKMVPLDPHEETSQTLAHSVFINYDLEAAGIKEDILVAGTLTYANLAGKVLFFTCYAPKKELESTRLISKKWINSVLTKNEKPPIKYDVVSESHQRGINWKKVARAALIGGLAGGGGAFLFLLIRNRRKKT